MAAALGWAFSLLLVGVIIRFLHGEALALRLYKPLVGVRVIGDIGRWIISNDVIYKVFCPGVLKLMRLSWRADKSFACSDFCNRIACAKLSHPDKNKINLPLSGMSVKWKVGRARRQFGEFDIEWVSDTCNTSVARCAECLGDVTAQ